MPLVCTPSPTTLTHYGRGFTHLLRLTFALLTLALITAVFGLCNIINLSHASLGPPTTSDPTRAARKLAKFWLDTLLIGPATVTALFGLYAVYRWTTSRMSVSVNVVGKVVLIVWWIVALRVQLRGDCWNVWREWYGWTMYKTQGGAGQRLYSQQAFETRTNQPAHVFMVVGGVGTLILIFAQILLELTLLYLQHSSSSLRLHGITDSWLESGADHASLASYSYSYIDENTLKTAAMPSSSTPYTHTHAPRTTAPPNNNQNRSSLTLFRPSTTNLFHIPALFTDRTPRTSTDARSFWTSIRGYSPRISTTTLPLFAETPARGSLEAEAEAEVGLPGYAEVELLGGGDVGGGDAGDGSVGESGRGCGGVSLALAESASHAGSYVNGSTSSSAPSSSSSSSSPPSSTEIEGSLHFSDRLDHISHQISHHNHTDATMDIAGPRVPTMTVGDVDVEDLVARITAEQEVRFQRALEEQARRFEGLLGRVRG